MGFAAIEQPGITHEWQFTIFHYEPLLKSSAVSTNPQIPHFVKTIIPATGSAVTLDDIKHDYDKRLQSVELSQKILQWLACALIVLILGTMLRAGWFDRAIELANRSSAVIQSNQPAVVSGSSTTQAPIMVPQNLGYYILGSGGIVGACSILAAFIVWKRQK